MPMPERHRFARSSIQTICSLSIVFLCGIAAGCESGPANRAAPSHIQASQEKALPAKLTAFQSDAQLRQVLRRWVREPAPPPPRRILKPGDEIPETVLITGSLIKGTTAVGVPVTNLTPQDFSQTGALTSVDLFRTFPAANEAPESMQLTGSQATALSITNTQEARVDEGDIVKLHGSTLVILRRGRLFTVSIAGGKMQPIDSINAYPPGVDARDDWYDEMLLTGDRIVVIGYSYARGGSEINRFRIDGEGRLSFEDAYQLSSNDYYSSRNYASRLIGNKLIFYSPISLPYQAQDPLEILPTLRRWDGKGRAPGFRRFASARNVHIPPILLDTPDIRVGALHTVTSCDLLSASLACTATSVLGADGHSFYVSENAVYVWTTASFGERSWLLNRVEASLVYRLPLDGGTPSAIGAYGAPTDQFSFREDMSDRTLNVLVRAFNTGEAFWSGEYSMGAVALLRIPLSSFGNGSKEAEWEWYRSLPTPPRDEYSFQNRFVGDYVLYGTGNGYFAEPVSQNSVLIAASVRGETVSQFLLNHGADRIEIMGRDALVVGSDETNLYFSTIDLSSGSSPSLGEVYAYADAAQAETRSHAYFFKPDTGPNIDLTAGTPGVLGLPVARPARAAVRQLFEESAAMVFLRRAHGKFSLLGDLAANDERVIDDNCVASCVDWYGNARPIFLGERVFALLGYELVEGQMRGRTIRETGRVNFAPGARGRPRD